MIRRKIKVFFDLFEIELFDAPRSCTTMLSMWRPSILRSFTFVVNFYSRYENAF